MTTGIRVEGVSASYRNKQVLFDVSCQAQPGEITALLGPNGSGKSTLLKAALGLIPASGEIHINGQSLDSLAPAQRAREVAYVPQRTQLMARLSVTEVVELGRFAHRGPPYRDVRAKPIPRIFRNFCYSTRVIRRIWEKNVTRRKPKAPR